LARPTTDLIASRAFSFESTATPAPIASVAFSTLWLFFGASLRPESTAAFSMESTSSFAASFVLCANSFSASPL
jgi:hypothetical protein